MPLKSSDTRPMTSAALDVLEMIGNFVITLPHPGAYPLLDLRRAVMR